MKMDEDLYGKLWMRHRRLELEAQIRRRSGKSKNPSEDMVKKAIYAKVKSGRWLTATDLARNLQFNKKVVEKHLRDFLKKGLVDVEFHYQVASYKIKQEIDV